MKRILVVEDEEAQRVLLTDELSDAGYKVWTADTGEAALELLEKGQPDLVTLDLQLPGMSGLDLLAILGERWPDLPCIVCTAYGDKKQDFRTWRALDYWVKDDDLTGLLAKIRAALSDNKEALQ